MQRFSPANLSPFSNGNYIIATILNKEAGIKLAYAVSKIIAHSVMASVLTHLKGVNNKITCMASYSICT